MKLNERSQIRQKRLAHQRSLGQASLTRLCRTMIMQSPPYHTAGLKDLFMPLGWVLWTFSWRTQGRLASCGPTTQSRAALVQCESLIPLGVKFCKAPVAMVSTGTAETIAIGEDGRYTFVMPSNAAYLLVVE